ncbi:beta-ribofuranosylaminobenzene 5'-phosphate synthase family protein [Halovenus rubra]|uniref:Beta-ribofuranosylaminobenzene 5'-phosphate synthase family protein n=2 Tax=Halovenus rubra TaxID=869890 RepID=A0ACC7DZP5_9EURY|nr:beta-ribofuranosylaminobenzene 5'-phosphate synthase family protein [Halovenus rubra]
MVTVETGARLHFGFQNLSLAYDRLYGGIGVGLDEPALRIETTAAQEVRCADSELRSYVETAVDVLDVPGIAITVKERFGRHIGLGSGTQIALACLVGIADTYDLSIDPRQTAPRLGRGGRSGVGVATFEDGGFIIDSGHRSTKFTTDPPNPGNWSVPEPIVQQPLPADWRFLVVTPETSPGNSGEAETSSMEATVESANPGIADDIAAVLTRSLLPSIAEQNIQQFGEALERIGRLNGAWYADEQGGVYRPPVGTLIEELCKSRTVFGAGQSSWGPTVYGVTNKAQAQEAKDAGETAVKSSGLDGRVSIHTPSTDGYISTE